mgnify:CR=1 FL=1
MFGRKGKVTFKTPDYVKYQNEVRDGMMEAEWLFGDSQVAFDITVGLSNRGADIDNIIKPLLDTYQGIFEDFNDNKVYHLDVTKTIVKKGEEFIDVTVKEYHEEPEEVHNRNNKGS